MTGLFRLPAVIVLGGLVALAACNPKGADSSISATTSAGKAGASTDAGQVVARVDGEEITIHQLNTELTTVNGAGQDAEAVRKEVLRAIVLRTMLRQAAVKERLDREPSVSLLMQSAKDKVLADAYVGTKTSKTPPPTTTEVAKYISDNPLQFGERRVYRFERLTMPTAQYSQLLVPMFDEKPTFDEFRKYLDGKSIPYTLTEVRLPSTDFPKQVQDQLVKFNTGDNVVVRGTQSVVILKIKGWVEDPTEHKDAERTAENVLHQRAMQERALALRGQMEHASKVEFLGQFSDMTLDEPKPAPTAGPAAPTVAPAADQGPAGVGSNTGEEGSDQ